MKTERRRRLILKAMILSCVLVFSGCGAQEKDADETKEPVQTEPAQAEDTQTGDLQTAPVETEPAQTEDTQTDDTQIEPAQPDTENPEDMNGIFVTYSANTPVLVDLDKDGKDEQVQIWYEENAWFPTIQIDDRIWGEEFWQEVPYNVDNPWTNEWYGIDINLEDGYREIGLFDEGPSDDPYMILLRYDGGELRYIGGFTSYPHNARIEGDGTVYATLRIDILETNFAEGYWKLENEKDFQLAQLVLQEREVYEILSYKERWEGENCPTTLQQLQLFKEQNLTSELVILEPGERVIPYRYYPDGENGWVEFVYGDDFGESGFVYINGYARIYQTNQDGEIVYWNSYEMLDGLWFVD